MSIDAMSNALVHVRCCHAESLRRAIVLAMADGAVASWAELDGWIVFYWSDSCGLKLPSKMRADAVVGVVAEWCGAHEPREDSPDIDGSISRGYEMTNAGSDRSDSYEQFRVRPIWAEHHK